jgi:hypothetical protein
MSVTIPHNTIIEAIAPVLKINLHCLSEVSICPICKLYGFGDPFRVYTSLAAVSPIIGFP